VRRGKKIGSFSSKHFLARLGTESEQLLSHLQKHGFYLTLVGGAVRDYLQYGAVPSDLDFEIRSLASRGGEGDEWLRRLDQLPSVLSNYLGDQVKIESLPCRVYRFIFGGREFELSSPRLEHYQKGSISLGHSDFDLKFSGTLNYQEAFSRRDLTINAIGIELSFQKGRWQAALVDPYLGVGDLERGLLCEISDKFSKDPVRLLRLLRFESSLSFKLSDSLVEQIPQFNLSRLTPFHFIREGVKGEFFPYIHRLFSITKQHGILHPPFLLQLNSAKSWPVYRGEYQREEIVATLLMFGVVQQELALLAEMMQIRKSRQRSMLSFLDWITQGDLSIPHSDLALFKGVMNKLGKQEVEKLPEGSAIRSVCLNYQYGKN
jgi:hypothetical protein